SLGIKETDDGTVLLNCRSKGCTVRNICKALGIEARDLFANTNGQRIVATYDYVDEAGCLKYQSVRFDPKDFKQRRPKCIPPKSDADWIWNLKGIPRLLYNLPEIVNASKDAIVFIPEGEKDVETLREHELFATCNSGGAGKWHTHDCNEIFRGRIVVILADN